nr:HlyD family efflux transporter periplasmic adaptor subunit [Anaerolineae bacterium]
LDEALLKAQVSQAQAALETAKAKLAQVKAGARPEEIAAAQAALAEARAAQEGAYRAWQNALEARDDPQQLEAQISQARTEVELARVQLDQARTALTEAEVTRDHYQLFQGSDEDKTKYLASLKQVEAAQANVQAAEATLKGAQVQLEHLLAMKEKPLVLNAQVNAARAEYQAAQAAVEMAQAKLEALEAGPTEEEVAVAQAEVARAEAALGVLEVQLEKLTLRSPTAGLVTGRMAQVGEMAVPGVSLMTVADLDEVTLTVYIPEDEIGRVKVGQAVEVSVDSFPGKVFDEDFITEIMARDLVTPTTEYGSPTDIRVTSDGQHLYAFYETAGQEQTHLFAAKYGLTDTFPLVAYTDPPVVTSTLALEAQPGDELLNDPAPVLANGSLFVVTRLRTGITPDEDTRYRLRRFTTDLAQVGEA